MNPSRPDQAPSPRSRLGRFARRHRLLAVLVLADVATKMAAFELLPHDRAVTVVPGLQLYLAVNDWGVMGGVQGIGAVTADPGYTMLLAAGLLLFALAIHRLGASGLGFGRRLAIGTAVFFAVACTAQAAAPALAHLPIAADVVVGAIRAAALVVSLAFYAASRSALPRVAFTLLAAGALANSASHAYPPFAVVDFLMVPAGPVLAMLAGKAAGEAEAVVGVINLADLYVFAVPLLLLAWPPLVLFRRGGAAAELAPLQAGLRRQGARD